VVHVFFFIELMLFFGAALSFASARQGKRCTETIRLNTTIFRHYARQSCDRRCLMKAARSSEMRSARGGRHPRARVLSEHCCHRRGHRRVHDGEQGAPGAERVHPAGPQCDGVCDFHKYISQAHIRTDGIRVPPMGGRCVLRGGHWDTSEREKPGMSLSVPDTIYRPCSAFLLWRVRE
jgi:hypothetical protein